MPPLSDHDILIEIRNDLKHLVSNFETHVKDDRIQWKNIEQINQKIAKWTGVGTGAGVVIGFVIKAIFR